MHTTSGQDCLILKVQTSSALLKEKQELLEMRNKVFFINIIMHFCTASSVPCCCIPWSKCWYQEIKFQNCSVICVTNIYMYVQPTKHGSSWVIGPSENLT